MFINTINTVLWCFLHLNQWCYCWAQSQQMIDEIKLLLERSYEHLLRLRSWKIFCIYSHNPVWNIKVTIKLNIPCYEIFIVKNMQNSKSGFHLSTRVFDGKKPDRTYVSDKPQTNLEINYPYRMRARSIQLSCMYCSYVHYNCDWDPMCYFSYWIQYLIVSISMNYFECQNSARLEITINIDSYIYNAS